MMTWDYMPPAKTPPTNSSGRPDNSNLVGIPIDATWEIGSAAGQIYEFLDKNAPAKFPLAEIRLNTGMTPYHLFEGIGWLACQEKILLSKDEKTAYAKLNK